jgi:O-antigen ligase
MTGIGHLSASDLRETRMPSDARPSGQPTEPFPAWREGRPAPALFVFWSVAFFTLVFGHYQISGRLNAFYKLLTVLVCLIAPLTPGFFSLLRKRQLLYLLAFEAVLILGCLAWHTGSPSDIFRVGSQPVVFVRVFPFILCGYTLALHPRRERWFIGLLLLIIGALTLPDSILLLRGTMRGIARERFLIDTYDQASAMALVSAFVNFSVLGLFLALAGFRLYDSRRRVWRVIIVAPQVVLASLSITAGFTAAAVLFVWSSAVGILVAPAKTLRFRVLTLLVVVTVLPLGYYGLRMAAFETGGAIGKIYSRLEGLRRAVVGEDGGDVNRASSGRLDLAYRSIESFVKSPLVGMGKGRATSEKGGDTDTIGGHSFLLDSLGQRGLLGTLPLLAWLASLAMTAWRCKRHENSWRAAANLTFLATFFVAIIINPYFLGYLSLNSVIFLWFGLILGDAQRVAQEVASAAHLKRFSPGVVRRVA